MAKALNTSSGVLAVAALSFAFTAQAQSIATPAVWTDETIGETRC